MREDTRVRIIDDQSIRSGDNIALERKKRGEKGKYWRDKVVEPYKVSKGKWV